MFVDGKIALTVCCLQM